ncbi:unnamed protein product [marine sediment metagenome]|uniref:Uncharacterized protein n=1 Tax=marine sediment metagenome TaxID=412755 RepID=X1V5P7_9ZZZZ
MKTLVANVAFMYRVIGPAGFIDLLYNSFVAFLQSSVVFT